MDIHPENFIKSYQAKLPKLQYTYWIHSLVENALPAFKVYFVRQPNVSDEDDLVAARAQALYLGRS